MKKKMISLMLVGAMAFSMTACGLNSTEQQPAADNAATDDAATDDAADATDDAAADDAADDAATDDAAASDAPAANDPAVTLVMAEVNPLDTIVGQQVQRGS